MSFIPSAYYVDAFKIILLNTLETHFFKPSIDNIIVLGEREIATFFIKTRVDRCKQTHIKIRIKINSDAMNAFTIQKNIILINKIKDIFNKEFGSEFGSEFDEEFSERFRAPKLTLKFEQSDYPRVNQIRTLYIKRKCGN